MKTRPNPVYFLAVGAALLIAGPAFRCPGPDPQAAPPPSGTGGRGGGGGVGGATMSSAATTSSAVSTSSASVVSSSSTSGSTSSSSGGCSNTLTDPMNCGACGRVCDPTHTMTVSCKGGVCDSTCLSGYVNILRPTAPNVDDGCEAPGRRVFVTSMGIPANFGGTAGSDTACMQAATAASLGGQWMAWTSDEASSPSIRFTQSTVPYVLLDGTPIAASWMALTTSQSVMHAINIDENGAPVGVAEVWTGTNTDGTLLPGSSFCVDWTSNLMSDQTNVGRADLTDFEWTNVFFQTCERTGVRLFCFEQ